MKLRKRERVGLLGHERGVRVMSRWVRRGVRLLEMSRDGKGTTRGNRGLSRVKRMGMGKGRGSASMDLDLKMGREGKGTL